MAVSSPPTQAPFRPAAEALGIRCHLKKNLLTLDQPFDSMLTLMGSGEF